jgi:hypothetical protein
MPTTTEQEEGGPSASKTGRRGSEVMLFASGTTRPLMFKPDLAALEIQRTNAIAAEYHCFAEVMGATEKVQLEGPIVFYSKEALLKQD